ncbi:MAG: hypothetical protein HN849_05690 [Victivallales bacterium]|nr:hypothetical protein [Victivallales bacterium]MBT7298979.1 hypothetical protein [Victivallales bacterium]
MTATRIWQICLISGWLMALAAHGGANVVLASTGASTDDQRWRDVKYNLYAATYRASYTYDQAQVVASYEERAGTFVVRVAAANLKPNFAYQIKLMAPLGAACDERLGSVGRYWREEWDYDYDAGAWAWINGWNLNDKGDGFSPSTNDSSYLSQKGLTRSWSPTGLRYRFSMYLLLGYMVTDGNGNATADVRMDSSYHVLWREDQRTRVAADGPVVSHTFTPSAASPAYDADGTEKTAAVFGEWERLPSGGLRLLDGDYDVELALTEESFHEDGTYVGFWPKVMAGRVLFSSGTPPTFTSHPESRLARSGDSVQFSAALADGARRATTVGWRKDGTAIAGQASLDLDLGTVGVADAANYVCVATNDFGETLSQAAVLLVRDDLRTEAEYTQAVDDRDAQISTLQGQVNSMFTAGEVDAAIAVARPDRDGDGYTDQQEADRGTDPDLYTVLVEPGWNLISLARVPEDNTVATIFGAALRGMVGEVWQWNAATLRYETVETLEPQRGHWVFWDGEARAIEIHLPEHPDRGGDGGAQELE